MSIINRKNNQMFKITRKIPLNKNIKLRLIIKIKKILFKIMEKLLI